MGDDQLVLIFVILFFLVWGIIAFRRWLYRSPEISLPEPADAADRKQLQGEAVQLLTDAGYEVTHGKWKVNMTVYVGDEELGSSLFIDYLARRNGHSYVVKIAKARKPVDVTSGSAVREQLLPYALLYDHTAGVLYVDVSARKVYQIRFELEL